MSTTSFNWSTPYVLSSSTLNSSDPRLVVDPNGNLVAIWVENNLIKSSSKNSNSAWTTPAVLSHSGVSNPNLVIDINGNATALWLEGGIVKTASKILTGSWSVAITLSGASATYPAIATDSNGNLVAVWVRAGNIESSTKLVGSSWQNKVTISSSSATSPRIAIGGSGLNARVAVVWYSTTTGLVYASTKLINGAWNAQSAISDPSYDSCNAYVAVDINGNATAIWYSYILTNNAYSKVTVQSSYKSNFDSTWNSIENLSLAGIRNPNNLSARIKHDDNGNAIAVWTTSFDGITYYIQSSIKPVRGKWSPVIDIANSLYSYKADLASTPHGDMISAFMFHNGSSLLILTSEINISGYNTIDWSVPMNVSSETNNGFPHIVTSVMNNSINAAVAWMHFNGTNNVIQVSVGSRAMISPITNLMVTQNNNNFGVFNEYYNTLNWTASTNPNILGYLIFRNGIYLKQISSKNTIFIDNNQNQNESTLYGVAAVDKQNSQSKILTISYN